MSWHIILGGQLISRLFALANVRSGCAIYGLDGDVAYREEFWLEDMPYRSRQQLIE